MNALRLKLVEGARFFLGYGLTGLTNPNLKLLGPDTLTKLLPYSYFLSFLWKGNQRMLLARTYAKEASSGTAQQVKLQMERRWAHIRHFP